MLTGKYKAFINGMGSVLYLQPKFSARGRFIAIAREIGFRNRFKTAEEDLEEMRESWNEVGESLRFALNNFAVAKQPMQINSSDK